MQIKFTGMGKVKQPERRLTFHVIRNSVKEELAVGPQRTFINMDNDDSIHLGVAIAIVMCRIIHI